MTQLIKVFHRYRRLVSTSDTTSLAYYMILSVIPILSLLIVSLSFLNLDVKIMKEFLLQYFSKDIASLMVEYLSQRSQSYFSVVTIGMCLMVSSRGVFRLKQVTNRLYEIPNETLNFFRNRIYAVFNTMTFILFSVILIMSFGLLSSLAFILNWFAFGQLSKVMVEFMVSFILMLFINLVVPSIWPGFKAGSMGALVSACGMTGVMVFMNVFSNAATYNTIYGPLASLAAILILLNWMSHIIYFGICFSSVVYLEDKVKEARYER